MNTKFFLSIFLTAFCFSFQNVSAAPVYRGINLNVNSSAQDINDLAAGYGPKSVRVQFFFGAEDSATKAEYQAWITSSIVKLDALLPTFAANNMKVVIDLHSAPGGLQNFGTYNNLRIFQDLDWQQTFIETWQTIATHYKDNTTILWYELLNEPRERNVPSGLLNWNKLAQKTAEEIRKIDTKHGLVMNAIDGDQGKLGRLKPLKKVGEVIYTVHSYNPLKFLHQGLYGRKLGVKFPDKDFTAKTVAANFDKIIKFSKKYKAKIYISEFSTSRYSPGASGANYLKALITTFERNKFSWAFHAWREAETWSIEHPSGSTSTEKSATKTDRGILLEKYFRK